MKALCALLALMPWAVWLVVSSPPRQAGDGWVVLVSGDADGYLSPCGCTKPMSGGMRRMATAAKQLRRPGRTVHLENGGLVAGAGRQDEIKAETLAEAFRRMEVAAINLGPAEARLGPGAVASISRLSGGRLLTSVLRGPEALGLPRYAREGPFLIGAASAQPEAVAAPLDEAPLPLDTAVEGLVRDARVESLAPVLLLQGDEALARKLASDHPALAMIVYRSRSAPPREALYEGGTLLVTPGDRARHLVRVEWQDGGWRGYGAVNLGPQFADDPEAERLYRTYQARVRRENLLASVPREPSEAFAGSKACGSCHSTAHAAWSASAHAAALKTLEREGSDADPDCTGCHVVGLKAQGGFRSRLETPQLADVGCESCHGPAKRHAENPQSFRLPKAGERSCRSCHNPDHSPGFDFDPYWARIAHGLDPAKGQ
jgi:hypothetical protein